MNFYSKTSCSNCFTLNTSTDDQKVSHFQRTCRSCRTFVSINYRKIEKIARFKKIVKNHIRKCRQRMLHWIQRAIEDSPCGFPHFQLSSSHSVPSTFSRISAWVRKSSQISSVRSEYQISTVKSSILRFFSLRHESSSNSSRNYSSRVNFSHF